MQIFVTLKSTHVLCFDDDDIPTGYDIKCKVGILENTPIDYIYLQHDGRILDDESPICPNGSLIVRCSLRLFGGKGGFGAMLRSLAKQAGKKRTTDFGACRDLSGRRLRHVNDEIVLQKWKEAKDRNEEFDAEENTKTGIDLWYLGTPSWVDGFKGNYRKRFMKPRRKTRLCLDWLRAREEGTPPADAPKSWGCPRGDRCDFAHGEDDLQEGVEKEELRTRSEAQRYEMEKSKHDQYMSVLETDAAAEDSKMYSSVLRGLRATKRIKVGAGGGGGGGDKEAAIAVDVLHANSEEGTDLFPPPHPGEGEIGGEGEGSRSNDEAAVKGTAEEGGPCSWLEWVGRGGDTRALVLAGGSAECLEGFATIVVCNCAITTGSFFYEVQLLTSGLMQIGWADSLFPPVARGRSAAGPNGDAGVGGPSGGAEDSAEDGVGDDGHSWAYDGLRCVKWNGGYEQYGPVAGKCTGGAWRAGDFVGCAVRGDERGLVATFYLNGKCLGPAFAIGLEVGGVFPALSLGEQQAVRVNIGHRAFRHFPEDVEGQPYLPVLQAVRGEAGNSMCGEVGANEEHKGSKGSTCSADDKATAVYSSRKQEYGPIRLEDEQYATEEALASLGLDRLKHELAARGAKSGGTLAERAARLLLLRGIDPENIPQKLKAKSLK